MESIEERALKKFPVVLISEEMPEDYFKAYRQAFIDGAKSEHEELTKWNSSDNPPDNAREVLIKVVMGHCVARYHDESCLAKGWYVNGNLYTASLVVGWREIHE